MSLALIKTLQEQRDGIKAELNTLNESAAAESRSFNETEKVDYDAKVAEVRGLDERIADEIAAEARSEKNAAAGIDFSAKVTNEPNPIYRKDDNNVSFFRDLMKARVLGDAEARGRLAASQETRAGDLASSTSTTGGTFAPPLWLVDEFVKLARPGRVTADLLQHEVLPKGISSINLPTVATGTATAAQSTQNTGLQDTAMTTGSVSSGITTIGGKQIVSLQMIDQSGIPFDRVVLGDLTADYAKQIGLQAVTYLGGVSGINTITNSNASVTLAGLYGDLTNALAQVAANRFLPADAIVMHPTRWYWILSQLDAQNRPLVVASGDAFNQLATAGTPMAEGSVGNLLGLPVYVDPNMPISGTSPNPANAIYVIRRADNFLFESELQTASFDATYADQASILFRVHGYAAFINRYPKAIAQIGGAAFSAAPAFAG